MRIETTVCIVGAGPAGVAASLFLAKAGIDHILLDKTEFPRNKVCGDALTMEVMHTLNRIDPAFVQEMQQQTHEFLPSWALQGYAPNGKALTLRFAQQLPFAPFYTTKRFDFDQFLIQKIDSAHATTFFGVRIEHMERVRGKVVIRFNKGTQAYTLTTPLLFGADGATSTVARYLSDAKRKNLSHTSASIRTYFSKIEGNSTLNELEFYFLRELLPGYFWIFPMPNGLFNVGVIVKSDQKNGQTKYLRQHFYRIIEKEPLLKHRFREAQQIGELQGWMLPLNSARKQLAGENYLLLGDAGSLIEPFSGKGIGIAMVSGKVAAEFAEKAIAKNKFDAATLREYNEAMYQRYRWEWYWSWRFHKWYESATFVNCFTAAYQFPGVQPLTERLVNRWIAQWMH